jgi:hypothetical protein
VESISIIEHLYMIVSKILNTPTYITRQTSSGSEFLSLDLLVDGADRVHRHGDTQVLVHIC